MTNVACFLLTVPCVCQQQEHTDTVHNLRFTLDFAHCLVEVAGARGAGVTGTDACGASTVQQQSPVADRISSLSRDWRSADPEALSADPEDLKQEVLHLLVLLLQPCRTAGSLPEERRAVVRRPPHGHGAGRTGQTLPISHC